MFDVGNRCHTYDTAAEEERRLADVTDEVERLADWAGIAVPDACRPGVAANLAILLRHARIVAEAARAAPDDPAELLRP